MIDDLEPEDPPPLLRSWRNMYALVIAILFIEIILFYVMTRWLD